MNKRAFQAVRNTIAAHPWTFDQSARIEKEERGYDTFNVGERFPLDQHNMVRACIIGHAALLRWGHQWDGTELCMTAGREYLGLSNREASHIFMSHWTNNCPSEVTSDEAIEYLDRCITTGEVK